MTPQFYNTTIRLIRDVSFALGRDPKDPQFVGRFCLPMVGNLGHECGGFLKMEEGKPTVKGSLGGISFAQWTGVKAGGRRGLFMAFCRKNRLHPYGYDAAVDFLVYELSSTAKGVVIATYNAGPVTLAEVPGADPALLGRVVRFEKLYENAGVKHYKSRYQYALLAMEAYKQWVRQGFPEPGKFIMPKSRFSDAFDREFGKGLTETTGRWDTPAVEVASPLQVQIPAGATAVPLPDGRLQVTLPGAPPAIIPAPTTQKGSWPEDHLTADEIKAIQTRLRDLGYVRVGLADGRWTQSVRNAILAMQAEHGLATDGHYGPQVRQALLDGLRHKVDEVRANATEKQLVKAGEPTLTAAQPVSIVAKLGTYVTGALTMVTAVASYFPQASTLIDGAKDYITDVPPYVWTAAILLVAAYLWYQNHQVKKIAVENFQTGANTALANPLPGTPANTNTAPAVPLVPGGAMVPGEVMVEGVADHPWHEPDDAALGLGEQPETPDDVDDEDEARPLGDASAENAA